MPFRIDFLNGPWSDSRVTLLRQPRGIVIQADSGVDGQFPVPGDFVVNEPRIVADAARHHCRIIERLNRIRACEEIRVARETAIAIELLKRLRISERLGERLAPVAVDT